MLSNNFYFLYNHLSKKKKNAKPSLSDPLGGNFNRDIKKQIHKKY